MRAYLLSVVWWLVCAVGWGQQTNPTDLASLIAKFDATDRTCLAYDRYVPVWTADPTPDAPGTYAANARVRAEHLTDGVWRTWQNNTGMPINPGTTWDSTEQAKWTELDETNKCSYTVYDLAKVLLSWGSSVDGYETQLSELQTMNGSLSSTACAPFIHTNHLSFTNSRALTTKQSKPLVSVTDSTGHHSIFIVLKPTTTGVQTYLSWSRTGNAPAADRDGNRRFGHEGGGELEYIFDDDATTDVNTDDFTSTITISTSVWQVVGVTFDGTDCCFYRAAEDGQIQSQLNVARSGGGAVTATPTIDRFTVGGLAHELDESGPDIDHLSQGQDCRIAAIWVFNDDLTDADALAVTRWIKERYVGLAKLNARASNKVELFEIGRDLSVVDGNGVVATPQIQWGCDYATTLGGEFVINAGVWKLDHTVFIGSRSMNGGVIRGAGSGMDNFVSTNGLAAQTVLEYSGTKSTMSTTDSDGSIIDGLDSDGGMVDADLSADDASPWGEGVLAASFPDYNKSHAEPMLQVRTRMIRIEDLALYDDNNTANSPRALIEIYDDSLAEAPGKAYMHNIFFGGERTQFATDLTAGIQCHSTENNADESIFSAMRFQQVSYPFRTTKDARQSVDFLCEHWWVSNARVIFEIGAGGHLLANMVTFNDSNNPGSDPLIVCHLTGGGSSIGSNTDSFVFNSFKSDGGANFPNGVQLLKSETDCDNAVVTFRDFMLTHSDTTGQDEPYVEINGGQHVIMFENCRTLPRRTHHATDKGFARLIGLESLRPAEIIFLGGYAAVGFTTADILTDDSQYAEVRTLGVKVQDADVGDNARPLRDMGTFVPSAHSF
jgi:hypothetical protein